LLKETLGQLSSVLHQFPRKLYSSDYWTVVNPWCLPTNTVTAGEVASLGR